MKDIYLFIIVSIISFVIGLLMMYMIQKSRNMYYKKENLSLLQKLTDAEKRNVDVSEALNESNMKCAINEERITNLTNDLAQYKQENQQLSCSKDDLYKQLMQEKALYSASEESNKSLRLWIESAKKELRDSFMGVSKDIMDSNSKVFLESANDKLNDFASKLTDNLKGNNETVNSIVKPVDDELKSLQDKVISLSEKLETMGKQNKELKEATSLLSNTLSNNALRGKWGEEQLRRIVELAGMVEHIDYLQQSTTVQGQRPDMTILLSGDRSIAVDSKVPMNAYLSYVSATDEKQKEKYLIEHAKAVKNHIDTLYKKAYWKDYKRSVELVAMVVPYESGLSAALVADSSLFNYAMERNVLLLSPMTFYGFLKSVSLGWQENALSKNAKEIASLSKELIERFNKYMEYIENVGRSLKSAQENFDKATSSYNSRLLPTFNKIKDLNSGSNEYKNTYLLNDED